MSASSVWSASAVAAIAGLPAPTAPSIGPATAKPLIPGVDLWDHWPVQTRDGRIAAVGGGALYMFLSAPAGADPDHRHGMARIRAMHETSTGWRDLGLLLPDGHSPGSREWAGSAMLSDDQATLTLYFTAVGRRGEPVPSFDQRIFETSAELRAAAGSIEFGPWSPPIECVAADGVTYTRDMAGGGAIGTIKAFRDPSYFHDPADGGEYLLFTGSLAASASDWNGAIGLAGRTPEGKWAPRPPLITADGVNNELERPHVIVRDAIYYLFWSTQRKVFAAGGPSGPTGLYGMAADHLAGPWRPLNGTGLVVANPDAAPAQAFSWLVRPDLNVLSFVDLPGLSRPPRDAAEARAHFGGTPAPLVRIGLDGDRSWIE